MDLATVIGVVAGLGLIISSILIGGGGTLPAMLVMFPFATVKGSVVIAMKAFQNKPHDPAGSIKQSVPEHIVTAYTS